jgi:hypothetical protein
MTIIEPELCKRQPPQQGRIAREGQTQADAEAAPFNVADFVLPLSGSDGEKVLSNTTVADLASDTACKAVFVQNDPDSAGRLKVGFSATPKIKLEPGQGQWFYVTNLNKIKVQAISTATANYSYQV